MQEFKSVSLADQVFEKLEHDIIMQSGNSARNRIWIYKPVIFFTDPLD